MGLIIDVVLKHVRDYNVFSIADEADVLLTYCYVRAR